MKKLLSLSILYISLVLISGCGIKNIDNENVASTGDENTVIIKNSGDFVDASGDFVWVKPQNFVSGSDVVSDGSGNAVAWIKASRASDEWCIWKQYSNFGVNFLAEECSLDGRTLNLLPLVGKNIFAVQQDDYEIDTENMEDTLWIQIFEVTGSMSLADSIRDIAWTECDINSIKDKKVWNYDIYIVYGLNQQASDCNWYGNVNSAGNSLDKIFVVDTTKPKKFVFMNLKNLQNLIDLNSFKIN